MTRLLYIESSPRGAESASTQAAQIFLDALPETVTVERLDLFSESLPEFSGVAVNAKYQLMAGQQLQGGEAAAWSVITELVDQFKAADHYLITAPMWNFSIPYKLKHYIDLITHPGMTFLPKADGIEGLAGGSAVVIYARGGDYSARDGQPDPYDFQSPYLKAWLGLVGIDPVEEVAIQKTLAGPDAQAQALDAARARLRQLATGIA